MSVVGGAKPAVVLPAALAGFLFARRTRRALGLHVRIPRLAGRWLPAPARDVRRVRPSGGWRTVAAVVLSATPGSVVLDVDPVSGRAVVHDLFPGR